MNALLTALSKTELHLDSRSVAKVHDIFATCRSEANEDDVRTIHLLVTFVHSDSDMRIPVPAIPG